MRLHPATILILIVAISPVTTALSPWIIDFSTPIEPATIASLGASDYLNVISHSYNPYNGIGALLVEQEVNGSLSRLLIYYSERGVEWTLDINKAIQEAGVRYVGPKMLLYCPQPDGTVIMGGGFYTLTGEPYAYLVVSEGGVVEAVLLQGQVIGERLGEDARVGLLGGWPGPDCRIGFTVSSGGENKVYIHNVETGSTLTLKAPAGRGILADLDGGVLAVSNGSVVWLYSLQGTPGRVQSYTFQPGMEVRGLAVDEANNRLAIIVADTGAKRLLLRVYSFDGDLLGEALVPARDPRILAVGGLVVAVAGGSLYYYNGVAEPVGAADIGLQAVVEGDGFLVGVLDNRIVRVATPSTGTIILDLLPDADLDSVTTYFPVCFTGAGCTEVEPGTYTVVLDPGSYEVTTSLGTVVGILRGFYDNITIPNRMNINEYMDLLLAYYGSDNVTLASVNLDPLSSETVVVYRELLLSVLPAIMIGDVEGTVEIVIREDDGTSMLVHKAEGVEGERIILLVPGVQVEVLVDGNTTFTGSIGPGEILRVTGESAGILEQAPTADATTTGAGPRKEADKDYNALLVLIAIVLLLASAAFLVARRYR